MTKNKVNSSSHKKDTHNPFLTEADYQWMGFSDAVVKLLNEPVDSIKDDNLLKTISSYENTHKNASEFRLQAACAALATQPKTPFNQLLMTALEDFKRHLEMA